MQAVLACLAYCRCWKWPDDVLIQNLQIEHLRVGLLEAPLMQELQQVHNEMRSMRTDLNTELRRREVREVHEPRDDYFVTVLA